MSADGTSNDFPSFWLGTFGINRFADFVGVAEAAVEAGDIGFDTAPSYKNEEWLGNFSRMAGDDVGGLRISSKLDLMDMDATHRGQARVRDLLQGQLIKTGATKLDVYYVHWPGRAQLARCWEQMLQLREEGLVAHLGICNVTVDLLTELSAEGIRPDVVQQEIHPLNAEAALTAYCGEQGVCLVAYTPTARLCAPIVESASLNRTAARHNATISQVIYRWHQLKGRSIAFSTSKATRIAEAKSAEGMDLTHKELAQIDSLDRRLVKFVRSVGCPGTL